MKKILLATLALSCAMQLQVASATEVTEVGGQNLLTQGIAAYQKANYADAVRYLNARARMQPPDAKAYYYLGNSYLQLKQNDDAAHAFSACIKVDAASQAGQYALQALERLSTMPKAEPPEKHGDGKLTPEQIEASKDGLRSQRALDADLNSAIKRIQNDRLALKRRVDTIYDRLTDELNVLNRRSTPNFYGELAKTKSNAEIEVEQLQKKQIRQESRLLAPDKIDVRAVPDPPNKKDDSKDALGALSEYFKPEKPTDPFGTEVTPEITAKFMSIRDVFGDLSTYEVQSRKLAQSMFTRLKSDIENKQDYFDQQVHHEKEQLIRDIYSIHANYPNQTFGRNTNNPLSYLTTSSIPRTTQETLTPMEQEIAQATDRTKKRLKDLQDNYNKDVDLMISGTKERLGSLIDQITSAGSQMKKPHGTIQIVPTGTTLNNRNYVNFGDRDMNKK